MTKLITLFIVCVVLFAGWSLLKYWEKVENEKDTEQKQAAASVVHGDQLAGLPYELQASLQDAEKRGAAALGSWLKTYGAKVQDPRKAWIELDYCEMVAREDPAEAKRVFEAVKSRTPPSSPVWPRIHDLEKSYE